MNAITERYMLRDKLAQCLNETGGAWEPTEGGANIGHWRVSLMQFGKTTLIRRYSTHYESFGVDLTFRQLDAMLAELAMPAIIFNYAIEELEDEYNSEWLHALAS